MEKIKVLLVDRRELFREGLAKILENESNIEVICKCSSVREGIEKASQLKPDIVTLDTEISDCNHVEVIQRINELLPETHVIILTHPQEYDHFRALKAGARAYLSKDINMEGLIGAIGAVHAGEVVISPQVAERLLKEFIPLEERNKPLPRKNNAGLSKRELEVLTLVAKGSTNREIATALFISESTVKVHLSRILEKIHAHNRQQAAIIAMEKGFIDMVTRSDA